jgi:D-3-phosphoglycerate dehydrogenase
MESVFAANYERDVLWAYDLFRARLRERGLALVLAECATDDEVVAGGAEAPIYLAYRRPVSRRLIERLPRLRLLISSGSGYDHIDVRAASERGILVCNSATYNVEDVAEHAVMLVMACGRKLRLLEAMVRSGIWPLAPRALPRHRFAGSTLGLIGFGKIGRTVAARAQALGMQPLVADPFVAPEAIRAAGGEPVPLEELLPRADFVSLHLRLDNRTRHLIGAPQLALMKPTAYLINTSRGGLVDESALVEALREGRIAGAGLDVLEEEPPPRAHPLLAMDNVIITGHTAGSTVESIHALVEEWLRIIDAFRAGAPPVNAVTAP